MKGVALCINPGATLVDICHTVPPQDIAGAAFVLSTVHEYFPARTVHLVVVDPGVGTGRRAVILRTATADFVAPDNGVLSYIIERYAAEPPEAGGRVELVPGPEAVAITEPKYWRAPVSATFHGRDIFAPVAAHLSLGVPPADFGEPVTELTVLPLTRPQRMPDGSLAGHIRHVDTFGNLITDIREGDLPPQSPAVTVEIGGHSISGLSRTYGADEGLLAVVGSSGCLEIALRDGSAADFLSAAPGDAVTISCIASY
jgi:S-adenosylmethionine hydrolase